MDNLCIHVLLYVDKIIIWIFDQFGYYDRYCCIINMNMFIVIFLYLCKCICIFFVPLINLMRYFVIFVMFSIIKHNSYHVMVHDWNKNILSYLILSHLLLHDVIHWKTATSYDKQDFHVYDTKKCKHLIRV